MTDLKQDDKIPGKATNPLTLEAQIMDSRVPKNEREWWAASEIKHQRETAQGWFDKYQMMIKVTGFDPESPCPICNGIEGCSHTVKERHEATRATPPLAADKKLPPVEDERFYRGVIGRAWSEAGMSEMPFFGESYEPGVAVQHILKEIGALSTTDNAALVEAARDKFLLRVAHTSDQITITNAAHEFVRTALSANSQGTDAEDQVDAE